jgi:hypothetical protein
MKVKHTDNGNVKITLSIEQAEALRAGLIYATGPTGGFLSIWTQEILAHIDTKLGDAEVNISF